MNEVLVLLPATVYLVLGITQVLVHRRRRVYVTAFAETMGAISNPTSEASVTSSKASSSIFRSDPLNYLLSQNRFLVALSIIMSMVVAYIFTLLALFAARIPANTLQTLDVLTHQFICMNLASYFPLPVSAAYSVMGAYIWGVYEMITMIRNKDWSITAQHFIWLRLPISCLMCQLLATQLEGGEVNPVVALGLGAVPIEMIYRYVRRATIKTIGGVADVESGTEQWRDVDGVTQVVLERLNRHDIETPTHLAYQEPFALYAKSNLEWRLLLDLMDQTLLATYLPGKLPVLRSCGVRGAIDMAATYLNRKGGDLAAQKQMEIVSQMLGFSSVDQLESICRNVTEDTQTHLLWSMWNSVQVPTGAWNPPNIN